MTHPATSRSPAPRHKTQINGSVLVGLLWCVALLSLLVIGVLHSARMDLIAGKNHADKIQAHYLAVAGIERATALLYHDARERSRSRQHHNGNLFNAPDEFKETTLGRGTVTILRRGRVDEGGGIVYGVSDEDGRLNINTVSADVLGRLPGMISGVPAAIVDWRDGDNTVTPNGAETEYYLAFQPPYQARNAPFRSVRELLLVSGVSAPLLFGTDLRHNALLDSEFEEGRSLFARQNVSEGDLGWAAHLTVHSRVANVNAAGESRVNVQSASQADLEKVNGISSEIARAIVSYRGQSTLRSLADLLDVTTGNSQGGTRAGQQAGVASGGRRVIDEQLLMDIADDITLDENDVQIGLVNINTASLEVLAALPGLDRELAQAILSHRQSSGFFPNVAWLLKVPGITSEKFKELASGVTVRSQTFRILAEGRVSSTGTRQRIQAIIDIGLNEVTTLSWREDAL